MIFTIDLKPLLRAIEEEDRKDRWTLAFTGICPRCEGKGLNRYVDSHVTGEIEIIPCQFCHSKDQLERLSEA
jgi:hypothetical protein